MEKRALNHAVGRRLKAIRKNNELTQGQMAEILDMSANYYGLVERGKYSLSLKHLFILLNELGVDLTYLVTGKELRSVLVSELVKDCPPEKFFDLEQIIRYACKLTK